MPQLEEIFANINREGAIVPETQEEKPNEETEEEVPATEDDSEESTTDSQPETKPEEDTPSHQGDDDSKEEEGKESDNTDDDNEKNLPFHKHPRFKQITDENNTLKGELEELKKGFSELKENNTKAVESKEDTQPPDWFVGIFGEDQERWKQFESYDNKRLKEIEDKVINSVSEKQKAQQEQVNQWEKWVDDEVQKLKDEGNEFDKNELIKTAIEYRPTDEKGNYDLGKALTIMNAMKASKKKPVNKKKIEARKKVADVSGTPPTEDKPTDSYTSKDLRNSSWHEL